MQVPRTIAVAAPHWTDIPTRFEMFGVQVAEERRQKQNPGASFEVRGHGREYESEWEVSVAIVPGGATVVSRPDDVERAMS